MTIKEMEQSLDKDTCVIYFSMFKAIKRMPDIETREKAYDTLLTYAFIGDFEETGDAAIDGLMDIAAPNIDASKKRYTQACNGGAPRKIDYDIVYKLYDEGMRTTDIAIKVNCSSKQVRQIIRNRMTEPANLTQTQLTDTLTITDTKTNNTNENISEPDTASISYNNSCSYNIDDTDNDDVGTLPF